MKRLTRALWWKALLCLGGIAGGAPTRCSLGCVVVEPAKPCTKSQTLQTLPQVGNCCLVMRGFHRLVV